MVRGRKLYHGVAQCLSCHPSFASRQEIDDFSKELTGNATTDFRDDMYGSVLKESDYGMKILPPDFTRSDSRSVRDDHRMDDLYRVIASGVGGTAMPTWKGSLPEEDIWALAHYVGSLVDSKDTPQARELLLKNQAADQDSKPRCRSPTEVRMRQERRFEMAKRARCIAGGPPPACPRRGRRHSRLRPEVRDVLHRLSRRLAHLQPAGAGLPRQRVPVRPRQGRPGDAESGLLPIALRTTPAYQFTRMTNQPSDGGVPSRSGGVPLPPASTSSAAGPSPRTSPSSWYYRGSAPTVIATVESALGAPRQPVRAAAGSTSRSASSSWTSPPRPTAACPHLPATPSTVPIRQGSIVGFDIGENQVGIEIDGHDARSSDALLPEHHLDQRGRVHLGKRVGKRLVGAHGLRPPPAQPSSSRARCCPGSAWASSAPWAGGRRRSRRSRRPPHHHHGHRRHRRPQQDLLAAGPSSPGSWVTRRRHSLSPWPTSTGARMQL